MVFNLLVVALAALVPMVVGFLWYGKAFGNVWMKSANVTKETLDGGNMLLIFGLSYLFSLMLASALVGMVIHQNHVFSALMSEPGFDEKGSAVMTYLNDFMTNYGTNFRTFKHGALHGTLSGLFIALPVIGTNAIFERKGGKYIAINAGFWVICMALMGGIICQFS